MFNQYFGQYLLKKQLLTAEQLHDVLIHEHLARPKLGVLAIDAGLMTAEEVEEVHRLQHTMDKKFGEIAIFRGYLTTDQLEGLLDSQQIKRLNPEAMGIILGLIGLSVAALVTLIWQEKRAASPLLPVGLLSHAAIWRSNGMSACAGASLTSQMTFLPLYLQVVDGATPSEIGFLLLPFSAGVGLGSVMTGRMISRTGRTAIFPSIGLAVTSLGPVRRRMSVESR